MPIRPELRKFYGREWYAITRPRILARAGNSCEQCGKPNNTQVWVTEHRLGYQYWTLHKFSETWIVCALGEQQAASNPFPWKEAFRSRWTRPRRILVQLGVAHLNHVAGDDRDENLKALCRGCHLNYDKWHHRETRAERKDRARPLLLHLEKIA